MTDEPSWDLQQRIYSILTTAPQIASGRVYDDVPEEVASATAPDDKFPYVQIGETDSVPDDVSSSSSSTGDDGESETTTLHTFSRYPGWKETKQLYQQVKERLHGLKLNVPGRSSAIAFVRQRRSFIEPDGKTRHGVISVEVIHRN